MAPEFQATQPTGNNIGEAIEEAVYAEARRRVQEVANNLPEQIRLFARLAGGYKYTNTWLGMSDSWLDTVRLGKRPAPDWLPDRLAESMGTILNSRPSLVRCRDCGQLSAEEFIRFGLCGFCRGGKAKSTRKPKARPDANGPLVVYQQPVPIPKPKDFEFGFFSEKVDDLRRIAEEADLALAERDERIKHLSEAVEMIAHELDVLSRQMDILATNLREKLRKE